MHTMVDSLRNQTSGHHGMCTGVAHCNRREIEKYMYIKGVDHCIIMITQCILYMLER